MTNSERNEVLELASKLCESQCWGADNFKPCSKRKDITVSPCSPCCCAELIRKMKTGVTHVS